jgi:hypothetical protein
VTRNLSQLLKEGPKKSYRMLNVQKKKEELLRKETGSILSRNIKTEVKKLVQKLKKEKRLPRGCKPDFERIYLVFDTEVDRLIQKYGTEIRSTIEYGKEKAKILTEIIIADYEKRQYTLRYDWELLNYLKQNRKEGAV